MCYILSNAKRSCLDSRSGHLPGSSSTQASTDTRRDRARLAARGRVDQSSVVFPRPQREPGRRAVGGLSRGDFSLAQGGASRATLSRQQLAAFGDCDRSLHVLCRSLHVLYRSLHVLSHSFTPFMLSPVPHAHHSESFAPAASASELICFIFLVILGRKCRRIFPICDGKGRDTSSSHPRAR